MIPVTAANKCGHGVSSPTERPAMTKWLGVTVAAVLALGVAAHARSEEKREQHKVEIADVKYQPAKIKVKKGATVIWINNDDRDHTVASKAKEKEGGFDSGKMAAGDKFEHTFEKPGKYEYGCSYHPRMKGVVEVTE
jgi:plastocyanin